MDQEFVIKNPLARFFLLGNIGKEKKKIRMLEEAGGNLLEAEKAWANYQSSKLTKLERKAKDQGKLELLLKFSSMGYEASIVAKALRKYDGSNEKQFINFLSKKRSKTSEKTGRLLKLYSKYELQNEDLLSQGFKQIRKNLKALDKFGGDQEKAKAFLEKKHRRALGSPKSGEKIKKNAFTEVEVLLELPSNIEFLYLDGNNMAFVDDRIRSIYLKKKKSQAETIIARLAEGFSCLKNVPHTHLMFDSTKLPAQNSTIVLSSSKTGVFVLNSARPAFGTSDDALVDIAGKLGHEKCASSLFVTSDRELQRRLKEKGASIMKPKCWFGLVKSALGEERYSKIIQNE